MRPAEAREMYANGTMPTFDAVVSFSSVEHSGAPPIASTPFIPMEGLPLDHRDDCLAEMWSGSEEGSYSRLIDCCITQL